MKILSVENLSRSFGGIKANDDISFNVDQGSILGIIGPNGACLLYTSPSPRDS